MARPAARLLVAEPDRLQLQLIDMLLSSSVYELTMVESGREALQHLKSRTPDLCLFALDLPDVAGDVICGKVRRVSRLARTPVILIAPQAGQFGLSDQARARARKVGADLVLPRPLGDKNLRNRIQSLLDEHETTPKREGFTTVVIEEALDDLPNDLPEGMADPEPDGLGASSGFADAPKAPPTDVQVSGSDRREGDRRGSERCGGEVDETFAAMQKELEMLRVENTQLRRKLQKKTEELDNTGVAQLEQRVAELERRNRALLDTIEKRGGDDEGRSGGLFGRRK